VLVVDASVVAPALVDAGDDGARIRRRLRGEQLGAPDLLGPEVLSVLRRQARAGRVSDGQLADAVASFLELPVAVVTTRRLWSRLWELRHNLSPYDASYVALAEALGCPLFTADRRLAAAPGPACPIEVL